MGVLRQSKRAVRDRVAQLPTPCRPNRLGVQRADIHGVLFEIPTRYANLDMVGSGACGVVCSARDHITNDSVAVKKIQDVFYDATSAKRTLRELRILRTMPGHNNIVRVRDAFVHGSDTSFSHIYVVMDLMEADLASILRSAAPLPEDAGHELFRQLLCGLAHVHAAGVIHRDLKPRNCLVNACCDLKIADFGHAVFADVAHAARDRTLTEYVTTRWYRAPEVLCSCESYSFSVDLWAAGCVLAELVLRQPLFPGRDSAEQLQLIVKQVGTPTEHEIKQIPSDKIRRFLMALPRCQCHLFRDDLTGQFGELGATLLSDLLRFDPGQRISADDALRSPFFLETYTSGDVTRALVLDSAAFEFEHSSLRCEELRRELILEISAWSTLRPTAQEEYQEYSQEGLKENSTLGGFQRSLVWTENEIRPCNGQGSLDTAVDHTIWSLFGFLKVW